VKQEMLFHRSEIDIKHMDEAAKIDVLGSV
jgi:hypothetical protein